jgi:hypothetical protein
MTYDDIAAAFLIPSGELPPAPEVPTTPARRLRDACEVIATQGWWSRPAADAVTALGLGFFDGYVWGRAAALGTPPASLVAATFGVFEPGLIGAVYRQGLAAAGRDDVLAARASGATAAVAAVVDDGDAAGLADPLLDALDRLDPMGRPLFAGLRELPRPEAAAGRLWRAAELVREHRGDGHLAACIATGLDAVEANVLTELWLGYRIGDYSSTRGFDATALGAAAERLEARGWLAGGGLTQAGLAARRALEAATDASQAALVVALGPALDAVVAGLDAVGARLLAAHAAPADPRKRAAG